MFLLYVMTHIIWLKENAKCVHLVATLVNYTAKTELALLPQLVKDVSRATILRLISKVVNHALVHHK